MSEATNPPSPLSTQNTLAPRFTFPSNPSIDQEHLWLGGPTGSAYRTEAQDRNIKQHCIKRDGMKCMACKMEATFPMELWIHHVDRNIQNNFSDNLQLMHPDCHRDTHSGRPLRRLSAYYLSRLGTPTPTTPPTQLGTRRDELLDNPTTTTNTRLNIEHEVPFRRACFKAVLDMFDPVVVDPEKFLSKLGLRRYAMAKSGSSKDASYGYMESLFAPRIGPLIVEKEENTVKFRNAGDQKLTVEQLMERYPKEGTDNRMEEAKST